jgi:hypothetical protein
MIDSLPCLLVLSLLCLLPSSVLSVAVLSATAVTSLSKNLSVLHTMSFFGNIAKYLGSEILVSGSFPQ